MFGYACDETPEFMPAPILWAHALLREHKRLRATPEGAAIGPDAKSQVTLEYRDGRPARVLAVVVSTQHAPDIAPGALRELVIEKIVRMVLPQALADNATLHINPGGPFVHGGPAADAGLTGRKIMVDTYGGYARHGGGGFSGKDPTKVDRSAAYAARQLAREIVARRLARHCEVRLAYAIGVAEPLAIHVDSFGTGDIPPAELARLADPRLFIPAAMISRLGLRAPIYRRTAAFGHFGRPDFPWERQM
jgi:S-adenosylmethionine synthetase